MRQPKTAFGQIYNKTFALDGARIAHSLEDAIVVAGGGQLYAETIDRADRLAITEVRLEPEGDVRFPATDPALWREVRREPGARGPKDDADFTFADYERRAPPDSR